MLALLALILNSLALSRTRAHAISLSQGGGGGGGRGGCLSGSCSLQVLLVKKPVNIQIRVSKRQKGVLGLRCVPAPLLRLGLKGQRT